MRFDHRHKTKLGGWPPVPPGEVLVCLLWNLRRQSSQDITSCVVLAPEGGGDEGVGRGGLGESAVCLERQVGHGLYCLDRTASHHFRLVELRTRVWASNVQTTRSDSLQLTRPGFVRPEVTLTEIPL